MRSRAPAPDQARRAEERALAEGGRGREHGRFGGGCHGAGDVQAGQQSDDPACTELALATHAGLRGEQVGGRDAGVCERARESPALGPAAFLQFPGEESDRDLRLHVRRHGVVGLRGDHGLVEAPATGGDARLVHHACPAGAQQGQQPEGEGGVTDVVRAPLQLEPVRGLLSGRRRHDPGVVDQQVEGASLGAYLPYEGVHRIEAGQIEDARRGDGIRNLPADHVEGASPFLGRADGQEHLGAESGEARRDDGADAVAGAGDDGETTEQGAGGVGRHVRSFRGMLRCSRGSRGRASVRSPADRRSTPQRAVVSASTASSRSFSALSLPGWAV